MSLLSVELSNWRILAAYTMVQWWTCGNDGSLLWGILLSLVMIFAIDWIILRSPESAAGGWFGMMQKETGETWVKSLAGTSLEFRQQHLHRSILILGSSTNLYYSLLQKQLIRRVTKSCFGGCSLLRGIVSTVELQMRHRCLGTEHEHMFFRFQGFVQVEQEGISPMRSSK